MPPYLSAARSVSTHGTALTLAATAGGGCAKKSANAWPKLASLAVASTVGHVSDGKGGGHVHPARVRVEPAAAFVAPNKANIATWDAVREEFRETKSSLSPRQGLSEKNSTNNSLAQH